MASVAVTKRAHLTAQVRPVENQCVVSGHSKTWFMTSTPRTAVARQLPNSYQRLFPTTRTFGLKLGGDYGTGCHFGALFVKVWWVFVEVGLIVRPPREVGLVRYYATRRTEEHSHFGTSIRRPQCLRKDTPHY